jgi:hypothetical protein
MIAVCGSETEATDLRRAKTAADAIIGEGACRIKIIYCGK